MKSVTNSIATVHFNTTAYQALNKFVLEKNPSCIFIIVDENTHTHCYPRFAAQLETAARIEIIEIEPGEEHKNINTCTGVWGAMVELGCDRNSLVINLGGGVVTDLGGFVASTIKRGIDFIHVPTTVLGMVDAAIGGKNGVDLGHLKNQIGVINPPIMTMIDTAFLATLSERQLRNGRVEMIKHGLIASKDYWNQMIALEDGQTDEQEFENLLHGSVEIKTSIVESDPFEKDQRKALNYGHTIGHAIESLCISSSSRDSLLHGEAIAAGLYAESVLSNQQAELKSDELAEIKLWYGNFGFKFNFTEQEIESLLDLMSHDKKNVNGEIKFVLLNSIGSYKTNCTVPKKDLLTILSNL